MLTLSRLILLFSVTLGMFLPWIKTPLNRLSGIRLLTQVDDGTITLIILLFLCCLILLNIIPVWKKRSLFGSGCVIILFVYYLSIYLPCFHRDDIVLSIMHDNEVTSRISQYVQKLEPDKENPLNSNFLSASVGKKSFPSLYKLSDYFWVTILSFSSGLYLILFSGISMIVISIRQNSIHVYHLLGILFAFFILSISCSGPLMGEIYFRLAEDSYSVINLKQAKKYLEKAGVYDQRLEKLSSFILLSGNINILEKRHNTMAYNFALADKAKSEGYYKEAMMQYTIAMDQGDCQTAVNNRMAGVCWNAGMLLQKRKHWSSGQFFWNLMPIYPGGKDGYLYSGINFLLTCRDIEPLSGSLESLNKALNSLDHRQIKADILVSLGCASNRLGKETDAMDFFSESIKEFSLAKIINYRAQKALVGY